MTLLGDCDLQMTVNVYRVGQTKRGQCSFFQRSKARFREFRLLPGKITVHLRTEEA